MTVDLDTISSCGAALYGVIAKENFAKIKTSIEEIQAEQNVPQDREISTSTPLSGGGDLSANRTLGINQATASTDGYLTKEDHQTFTAKMTNPMTQLGDLIVGGSGGSPDRLPAGGSGTVLHGGSVPWFSSVVEGDLSLSNISTANSTTARHGLLPKLSDNPSQFLDGQGNWVTPSGVSNDYTSKSFTNETSVTLQHNFGAYPLIQIINSSGVIISATSVTHTDVNTVVVEFSGSTAGTVLATLGSPSAQSVKIVSNDYVILSSDRIVQVSVSGKTVTLPTAVGATGKEFCIDNSSSGEVYATAPGELINGVETQTVPADSAIFVYSDGTNWRIF